MNAIPEQKPLSPPHYAGFWIRLVADILDSLVLTVASWMVEYVFLGLVYGGWALYARFGGPELPAFSQAFNALWLQIVNVGIYFLIAFPYYVWGQFRYGTTLGKWPLRIYVASAADLGAITIRQSIIRFFSYAPSYILFFAGFLMAGFHPEKRALHDLLAGTVSVRKPRTSVEAPVI